MFVIYLGHKSPHASSNLPPGIGRAVLHTPVYMILQPIRCTANCVTTIAGGLLLHLFTLIPASRNGYFLLHCLCPHEQLPVRKYGALCCPDFPPFYKGDKPVCCFFYKDNSLFLHWAYNNAIISIREKFK